MQILNTYTSMPDNRRSKVVIQGVQRSPNRALLRTTGFADKGFEKPIVDRVNAYSTITPCKMDIGMLETRPEAALREVGAMPQTFGIITISDGICMGTEGRKT